jgi:Transglycosylase SLT domain
MAFPSSSRAGAQGIAQFMPGTARWRGLSDPFEPTEALYESARWLGELRNQFGNWGLAAAAYNAGPRRVRDWIAGRGQLPRETRAYVRVITGRAAEEWAGVREEIQHDRQAGPCTEATKSPPKVESHISVEENANWVLGDFS